MSGYGARNQTDGLPLFDRQSEGAAEAAAMAPSRPVSRNSDPSTSKAAEARLRAAGTLNRQCREVLGVLIEYIARHGEAPTTAELAAGDAGKIHLYGRRLSDLRSLGHVLRAGQRTCKVTGNTATAWKPR